MMYRSNLKTAKKSEFNVDNIHRGRAFRRWQHVVNQIPPYESMTRQSGRIPMLRRPFMMQLFINEAIKYHHLSTIKPKEKKGGYLEKGSPLHP